MTNGLETREAGPQRLRRLEVHKFGGSSLRDAGRMRAVAELVATARRDADLVVVASAMGGVTDTLIGAIAHAGHGRIGEAIETMAGVVERHRRALADLGFDPADDDCGADALRAVTQIADGVCDLLRATSVLGEQSPRTHDRIVAAGEKMSVRVVALAFATVDVPATPQDADCFLLTNDHFGEATPLPGVYARSTAAALRPHVIEGVVPVVTGFCGRAPDGATTTLGRGGSDYTATLLAEALTADEVVIWTDVNGVYTADPRVVPGARPLPQLNFREAAELAYYGAKVLHQRTIIPVARLGIPVRICNSFEPDAVGTIVDRRFTPGSHPVKAISAVRGHALLSIEGKGMAGVPGVAARVFGALAEQNISVTLISQSSAESSICLGVPQPHAQRAELALKRAFAADLLHGDVEEIVLRRGVGLLAAVGLGMHHAPGVAARVFSSLGRARINVLAIAQGSSELNISLAVDERDIPEATALLHDEFGLHRRDTGEDTPRALDLLVLGVGKIGAALTALVMDRRSHVFERFGLEPRVVALADRSGYLLEPTGLSPERLEAVLGAKREGRPIGEMPNACAIRDPLAMVRAATGYRLTRPVLVDVSDAETSTDVFREAMRLGCDVVTANKKPIAGSLESFRSLFDDAWTSGRLLKAEATVGAGLPVVDTLEILMSTGDRLMRAEGCLSGTLAYLTSRLEESVPLSVAVADAIALGYTEPDPYVDLSGLDVARKAVILGRLSGLSTTDQPPKLEGLVGGHLAGLSRGALLEALRDGDAAMAARVDAARARGEVLRYVASISPEAIEVGPRTVPADSALARLRGADNMIVFHTERYGDRPLVVSGPGAGVEVTAMGVLGDILRVAAERR